MGNVISRKTAGVRKYFFFIKENVSSDWKDLAFHLGFERADTDNIASRNRDDKSCCMDLLEEWRKLNGRKATIEALMEALSEANLQSVVDDLNNEYPELETSQDSRSQQQKIKDDRAQLSVQTQVPYKEEESSVEELKAPHPPSSQLERQLEGEGRFAKTEKGHCEEEESSIQDVFQKAVKKFYELKLTSFKPLIWNDNFTLTLSDIFTQLELVPTGAKRVKISEEDPSSNQKRTLNTLDDLYNPDVTGQSTPPRCILIEGEAGGGKTTFLSKEALDAVSKKTELGKRNDIVLLIRLRDVKETETIEEMVMDQCVPEITDSVATQSIRAIIKRNESDVLFLLDGYDELRPEARAAGQAIPKLLNGKLYPYSTIVITSRPSAGVQQYTRPDCHVHIMGFSRRHVETYVKQYFSTIEIPELGERLATALKCNQIVADLVHTPIFLLLVCVLWEEDQEMVSTGTMTGLYNNLLTCLVRKHCKRERLDMPLDGLPTEIAESLLQLGKHALQALLRNETLVDLAQLENRPFNWELLVKLGVISIEVSTSKWHPRKQLNFSHKTMQEFLAGRYVAHVVGNQSRRDIAELLQLTSIRKALDLSNLLQFTCGCNPRVAQAVMEEVEKLRSKEFSHLQPSRFRDSHKSNVKKTAKNYEEFVLLCLEILNERKEPEVLQAVSKAVPLIIMNFWGHSKRSAALKRYLETIQSSNIQTKVILTLHDKEGLQYLQQIFAIHIRSSHLQVILSLREKDGFEYLQQLFASPILGLQLDLKLWNNVELGTPNQTTRLVSVLMNVPGMRALDLSLTGLTPSSLQVLVQGFSYIPLLEELDLSHNRALGDAGMEVLQVGLSSVPRLTVLRLGGTGVGMTAVGMQSMAPYMRHLAGLKELDIGRNDIGDAGLESLITALSIFTAMQVLVLARTGISATGMSKLVLVLCQLTRLIKLDISGNHGIGDPGLICLADFLPRLTAMKVLDLHMTRIGDRGISALIKALPHLVQLQVLDVSWNDIGDSGIVSLVETLCRLSSSDMKQNPPGDKSLTTAPHCNSTLQELNIGWNSVTGAGLERVAQLIITLPALTRLNMSGYPARTPVHLSDTAAVALAEALPRLPALEELDLRDISMDPAGFQAVVQAAEEHPTLGTLRFSEKRVPEGADTSASCLRLW